MVAAEHCGADPSSWSSQAWRCSELSDDGARLQCRPTELSGLNLLLPTLTVSANELRLAPRSFLAPESHLPSKQQLCSQLVKGSSSGDKIDRAARQPTSSWASQRALIMQSLCSQSSCVAARSNWTEMFLHMCRSFRRTADCNISRDDDVHAQLRSAFFGRSRASTKTTLRPSSNLIKVGQRRYCSTSPRTRCASLRASIDAK
jgi:hypothetical protein